MAQKKSNALGILFEVKGKDSLRGESGSLISKQLKSIASQITVDVKVKANTSEFEKKLKSLQKQFSNIKINIGGGSSSKSSGNKSFGKSFVEQDITSYKKATTVIDRYYKLLKQTERASTRTTAIIGGGKDNNKQFTWNSKATQEETDRWKKLIDQLDEAKKAYDDLQKSYSKMDKSMADSLKNKDHAADLDYQLFYNNTEATAKTQWGKLQDNVNEYIRRVEFSASRDPQAVKMLNDLKRATEELGSDGYDTLKAKLQETQKYINENSLATETWGQRLSQTLDSRIRSALAGVVAVGIGKFLSDIVTNVIELDKSVTDLQIATGKSRDEVKAMIKDYATLGKEIGATTKEIAAGADTWLRQGYDAEEANTLIYNSMMLAKLGQLESTEASTDLTSAMRGYKVEVEDSIKIVDKFTAVDMEAAASAGDIATAMAETAAGADLAGVSMNKLIGYIATVKETTQDAPESVGTFFRTLFARMNNVAAGNFIDEETGESLNDVEKVLNELDISLRDTNGLFRNSAEVLDEVAARWETFDNVQQHAIATAFAGKLVPVRTEMCA